MNAAPDLSLFADETFDFIFSALVLQHIEPRYALRYVREFVRLQRPDGRCRAMARLLTLVALALAALPRTARLGGRAGRSRHLVRSPRRGSAPQPAKGRYGLSGALERAAETARRRRG